MQLTWLLGPQFMPALVHGRVVGRRGLGSAATQLMRAVRLLHRSGANLPAFAIILEVEAEMQWSEVRQTYPNQWLIVEAMEAETGPDSQRHLMRLNETQQILAV